jgi:methylenetetrahydrofolate dehydrogenase (NADP+) / methenyltetrahydrofolate cyclohydrolase
MALGYEGFLPACAEAAVAIPQALYGYPLEGKRAVVIGRSNVVGKPVQLLLMREDCTVTVCHRRTRDLAAEVARAEIVVVTAAGVGPARDRHDAPARGACRRRGINVVGGRIVGDVDFDSPPGSPRPSRPCQAGSGR